MKWDETGIAVCTFYRVYCSTGSAEPVQSSGSFYRAAIPQDIVQGAPDPSNWGEPVAALSNQSCNITQNFVNHSIIFGENLENADFVGHHC